MAHEVCELLVVPVSDGRLRTNIQVRIATNRMTVTARFATVSTATSTPWWLAARGVHQPRRAAGDRQADAEDHQPLHLVTQRRRGGRARRR